MEKVFVNHICTIKTSNKKLNLNVSIIELVCFKKLFLLLNYSWDKLSHSSCFFPTERFSSQTIAKAVPLSQEHFDFDRAKIRSTFYRKNIDTYAFAQFVKENINIQDQMDKSNIHTY